MREDRFEMGQKERDRLKILHEAQQGQITQKQAGEQLAMSERQVRRLLQRMRKQGDRAVIHGLRGRASNRRVEAAVETRGIAELRRDECRDFGPTFASEHLARRFGMTVGRDTVRKWMMRAGLWKPRKRTLAVVHQWRQRRACAGELVQWDTSVHGWLENRGPRLYLIAMIDDASSQVWARFAVQDTASENMRVLWGYLERYGRPLEFYTDKAAMFEVTAKRNETSKGQEWNPTQITRALAELGIHRSSAHSPQAKGRIERFFETAQNRLVKGLRLAGASTLEQANDFLDQQFLPEWKARWTVPPSNSTDAHRPLQKPDNVPAALSHVETRRIGNDYTFQLQGQQYQIARTSARIGMRGKALRVEARLDGSIAARWEGEYLEISRCESVPRSGETDQPAATARKDHNRGGRSAWMKNFSVANRNTIGKMVG